MWVVAPGFHPPPLRLTSFQFKIINMESTAAKKPCKLRVSIHTTVMVTVYTQFGYATVDLTRYEKELEALPHSPNNSPDKQNSKNLESAKKHLHQIIEVHFRHPPRAIGYIQVSPLILTPF